MIPVDLAVDANRDGIIKFAGNFSDPNASGKPQDSTSQSRPFRFWINDDNDGSSGGGDEAVDSGTKDYTDGVIKTTRDLEDFTRLHLYIGGLQDAVADGTFEVGLEWKNVTGSPSIKVYRAAENDGGDQYLKTELGAGNQALGTAATSLGTVSSGGSFKLPSSFWEADMLTGMPALSAEHPSRYLIFEGAGEGKGQLVLTFWKGGQKIGEGGSVWIDLVNVRKMYERAKATPDSIAVPHGSTSSPSTPSVAYVLDPFNNQWEYPQVSWTETKEYVVFVHGWNTSYSSARTFFADTMFKRLWQRGYKGRFAALYWPTLVGVSTYNESEYRAWFFGESLKQYVNSLPGSYAKMLIAHSMGNIVAGSALRKGMSVEKYALIDAAVPASCYDPNPSLREGWGNSPDDDNDAPTQALAYKNKLASVNTTLVNFYLPSDDALALWATNNQIYKPEVFVTTSGGDHGYKYYPGNPSGQKLFLTFLLSPNRDLVQMEESLAWAAKSSTKAVGAQGFTRGPISGSNAINLASYGYEDEHSGPWKFTLQKVKPLYDKIMDKLGVERNE